jgi:hypothetical protein
VPNAREENAHEEAAEEVAAGTEEAQEGRDMMEQRDEEAAEGAEAEQALMDLTQAMVKALRRAEAEAQVRVDQEVIRQGGAIRQEEAEKQSLADLMQALAQRAKG